MSTHSTKHALRADAPSFHIGQPSHLHRGPLDNFQASSTVSPASSSSGHEESWITLEPLPAVQLDKVNVMLPSMSPVSLSSKEDSVASTTGSRDTASMDGAGEPLPTVEISQSVERGFLKQYGYALPGVSIPGEGAAVKERSTFGAVDLVNVTKEPTAESTTLAEAPANDPPDNHLKQLSTILDKGFIWPKNDERATEYVSLAEKHMHWVDGELRARCGAVKAYLEIKGKMTRVDGSKGTAEVSATNAASTTPYLPCMRSFHSSGKPIAVGRGSNGKDVEVGQK